MADLKALYNFLDDAIAHGPVGNGCIVSRDGEILFEGYRGFADREKQIPITEQSIYRQFSTSKLVTCTGAMQLFEQGKFLLNDPISEYFPEWKDTMVAEATGNGDVKIRPAKQPILVRDCFSMAMGVGYGGLDFTHQELARVRRELKAKNPNYTLREDIAAMSQVPIAFEPGTRWMYGIGHELVAGLVEVCSGKKLSDYMKENIFEPLGMSSTGYHFFGDTRERLVTAYEYHEDGTTTPLAKDQIMFEDNFEPDAAYEAGGAGLFSTVRDYNALAQMFACGGTYKGEKILGRKTIDLMRTNRLNEAQLKDFRNKYLDGYGYGLGVRTLMEPAAGNNASVGEFGWTGYMGTYVSADPEEGLSVVYMHNMAPNNEEYIHPRLRNIAYAMID